MRGFENIGRELERQGKADGIKRLAESEDGMKVSRMIDAAAIENAAKIGDSAALRSILGSVLSTEEGKRLAESVKRFMKD